MTSIAFIGKESGLIEKLKKTGPFEAEIMSSESLQAGIVKDIVIISDEMISINELLENRGNIEAGRLFYIVSRYNFNQIAENLLSEKGIDVIPQVMAAEQIMDRIYEAVADNMSARSNMYLFFGADSKVGTTMTAQCTAEKLAENKNLNVILLFLDGKPGTDFIGKDFRNNIDSIRIKIRNKILEPGELLDCCVIKDNLNVLQGTGSVFERKKYYPEDMEFLLKMASALFDVVIADAGSSIDSGMAIGALNCIRNKFLVTTQQQKSRDNFQRMEQQVLTKMRIKDFMLIINKYSENSALPGKYKLADQYGAAFISALPMLPWGWQCERDRHSLLACKDKKFDEGINQIISLISKECGNESRQQVYKGGALWTGKCLRKNFALKNILMRS